MKKKPTVRSLKLKELSRNNALLVVGGDSDLFISEARGKTSLKTTSHTSKRTLGV